MIQIQVIFKTFPEGTTLGALEHAKREIEEVKNDIKNNKDMDSITEEFADVFACLIDAVNRCGISHEMLNIAFDKKLEKNKNRTWVYNGDGSYSHVKNLL